MSAHALGRFTARGGADVEQRVAGIMAEVQESLRQSLSEHEYRAVVLLGGYGRGEGGVEVRDDGHHPHNNFDFLVIGRGKNNVDFKHRVDAALAPLIDKHGIGMDVGIMSESALEKSPSLVMWYDMRHGHKTVLGDASYVPSLYGFSLDAVPAWDVRNLLVNRGTLLVINHLMLQRAKHGEELTHSERRTVVKHTIKAIIGYGDALLYFNDLYDWSYLEKQKRMAAWTGAPAQFKALYDEAMEFRFQPRYADYLEKDLQEWNDELRRRMSEVHLLCERVRLGDPSLDWSRYADAAFARALPTDMTSPRGVAKKIVALRSNRDGVNLLTSKRAKLGFATSRMRERLPILFPAACYDDVGERFRSLAAHALGTSESTLARAYLRNWGEHGDTNFFAVLRKLRVDVSLEGERE